MAYVWPDKKAILIFDDSPDADYYSQESLEGWLVVHSQKSNVDNMDDFLDLMECFIDDVKEDCKLSSSGWIEEEEILLDEPDELSGMSWKYKPL